MANYVKISSLSAAPYPIDPDLDLQEAVEEMIRHWERELQNVLPDQPDLIVLPEVCDRPAKTSYPLERRLAYYRQRKNQIRDFFANVAKKTNIILRIRHIWKWRTTVGGTPRS